MKRALVTAFLVLIFGAIWQSLANYLPTGLNLFFPPPIILVFAMQFYRPLETILACLFCGIITDILGGQMVGSNMLLMLAIALLLSAFNVFSGRVFRQEQIFYVMAVSFIYRAIALSANVIFLGNKANVSFLQLIIGPLVDGLMCILFYKILVKMLALTKAIDQSDFTYNRLGLRR